MPFIPDRNLFTGPYTGFTDQSGATDAGAPGASSQSFVPNEASYYGLNIPVSSGKRAILGVPLWASEVRFENGGEYVDFAVGFGYPMVPSDELVTVRLLRLSVQGVLVVDAEAGSGFSGDPDIDYVLYPGTEGQQVDPRIEDDLGSLAPAFRGTTYIVFYDFPLHKYGNQGLPLIRAELADVVTDVAEVEEITGFSDSPVGTPIIVDWNTMTMFLFDVETGTPLGDVGYVLVVDLANNEVVSRRPVIYSGGTLPPDTPNFGVNSAPVGYDPGTGYLLVQWGGANTQPVISIDPYSGIIADEFGEPSSSLNDTEDSRIKALYMAPVSTSPAMRDHIMCFGSFVGGGVLSFLRLYENGALRHVYIDPDGDEFGDNSDPHGALKDIITGDPVGVLSNEGGGFGTVYVAREKTVYRITVPEGMEDSTPPTDDANAPVHEPATSGPYGGAYPGAYVDVDEVWDATNLGSTPSDPPTFTATVDLTNDVGDLSASVLSDRVVAYVDYGSARQLDFVEFGGHLNSASLGVNPGFKIVASADGVTWTEVVPLSNNDLVIRNDAVASSANVPTYRNYGVDVSTRFVGVALDQDDYSSAGDLEIVRLQGHGQEGLTDQSGTGGTATDYSGAILQVPLFSVSDNLVIERIMRNSRTGDIVMFVSDVDQPSLHKFLVLRLTDEVLGNPTPDPTATLVEVTAESDWLPFSVAFSETRYTWGNSDISANTLVLPLTTIGGGGSLALLNLRSGTLEEFDVDAWRFSGGALQVDSLQLVDTDFVWNSAGGYLVARWPSSAEFEFSRVRTLTNNGGQYDLADILRWLALEAGYANENIDVSGIDTTVTGSIVLERIAFQDLMRNIARAFQIDIFESEGVIKFVRRARGDSLTIDSDVPEDDLCPVDGGEGGDPGNPIARVTKAAPSDLPDRIELYYLDETTAYSVNSAVAQRTKFPVQTVDGSGEAQELRVPIIMTPQRAGLLTSRMLYELWRGQLTVEFRLPTKYLEQEPSDTLTLTVDGIEYTLKNEETTVNDDNSVSVAARTFALNQADSIEADSPVQRDQAVAGASVSELFVLDVPVLSQADVLGASPGRLHVYSAVVSKGQANWQGGSFWSRDPSGYNFQYENSVQAPWYGVAATVLSRADEHSVDDTGVLTVILKAGTDVPTACTDDDLLEDVNTVLYGAAGRWEVLQFRDVNHVGGQEYELSYLVRGNRATAFATGQHRGGDRVIFLKKPPVVLAPVADVDDQFSVVSFKGVGRRQEVHEVAARKAVMNAWFERMWPPTNLAATLSGSDVVLSWSKRVRVDAPWEDGSGVIPVDPEEDGFEVDILPYPGAVTPIRTVTGLTEPTYTYSQADLLADFGSDIRTLAFRVYHMSTRVGRGMPGETWVDVE